MLKPTPLMNEQLDVLVIGASENPQRYSYLAVCLLLQKGHRVIALGRQKGRIQEHEMMLAQDLNLPALQGRIHTVTMYIQPQLQKEYETIIIQLKPQRIIFNPGTENMDLAHKLSAAGIFVIEACTLVMLRTNQF